jgi:citrate lyase subunit beta/citryl-CoA lyase
MPAANERALEKAKGISTDAIIFDLEDAVSPDSKDIARAQAIAAVNSGEYGKRELTIRCNALATPWGHADVAAAAKACVSAVVIPKINSVAEVNEVSAALDAAGAPKEMMIWAMIETPTAIFDCREIAAHPRVPVLIMGTNDLAKELRAAQVPGRAPLYPSLHTALLAAREAGKTILDGVYNDIKNDVWSPSEAEVEHARKVIAAFDEALAAGKGVVQLDGRMIENLHVANAQRAIAIADAIAELS